MNALLVVHGQKTSLDGSTLVWRMSDGRTFQMLFARDGIDWAIYPPQAITSQGSYPAALFTGKYGPPNYPGNRFDPHRVIDFLRSKTSTQEVGRCTDKCMRPNTL
ncbi:hypothetical protein FDA94_28590 [Herbidospora galbida]|uniref:Uncharacterized protein n=1 Tax=Herbidospora galbida TaxID=2575442 RepID=A0A4U3M7S6_9ACTN|nr:hypothetical protein [Herbidospora galbida]TKK84590.1 hypothetical protein FDA94_28590 [Herbidospora galbida]